MMMMRMMNLSLSNVPVSLLELFFQLFPVFADVLLSMLYPKNSYNYRMLLIEQFVI